MENIDKYIKSIIGVFVILFLGIISYSLTQLGFFKGLEVFSIIFLICITSVVTGGFLGFLFSLPNYNKEEEKKFYRKNTSLKLISDWLTTIIVGISLIEFKNIINKFLALSNFISKIIGIPSSEIIISAVIIAFFVLGFVLVYISTITFLYTDLISNEIKVEKLIKNAELKVVIKENNLRPQEGFNIEGLNKNEIVNFVTQHKITEPNLAKNAAQILYNFEEYSLAAEMFDLAYKLNENDLHLKVTEAYIRSKYLVEFEKSNKILLELIIKDSSFIIPYYNLACNYYREYKEISDKKDFDIYKKSLNKKIEDNLRKAFELDSGLLSSALNDEELKGYDVEKIFNDTINR